ncbi:unnamed protein product, partial [Amoebophrya sp. A25]
SGGSSSSTAPPSRPRSRSQVCRNRTTQSKRILPRINRGNPTAQRPELQSEDMECGLYSLTNRGFLPSTTDLTPGLRGVMQQKRSRMYHPNSRALAKGMTAVNLPQALVKLDLTPAVPCPPRRR